MINRILIRIKVVQVLYSYLLLEKHFTIESQPTPPTKEKRFAYTLYLDTLQLVVRLALEVQRRGGDRPLYDDNYLVRNLLTDEKLRSLNFKYDPSHFIFASIIPSLVEKIKDSGIYKNFLKIKADKRSPGDETEVWTNILNLIIFPDTRYMELCYEMENFSLRGFERMKEMLSSTFTSSLSSHGNIDHALDNLDESLHKARELYFRLLLLPVALTELREHQIEENRTKFIRTAEDINPNMRFVENQLAELLASNEEIQKFAEENKINWLTEEPILMRHLLDSIIKSPLYQDYMEFPVTDLNSDCEFWRNAFKTIIFRDELFLENLEDKSVFWNDDLDIIGTFVLKTFKRFEDNNIDNAVLAMYKDNEDASFAFELFKDTVKSKDKLRSYIDNALNTSSWETERLVFMDIITCMTALAEIINFPKIPLQVSINEYIEIAKAYSSPKSGGFVHGLLSSIVKELQEKGIITKRGDTDA